MNIRVALAQINATVGDLPGNRRKIAEYLGKAKDHKADIVVFPELAVSGYPPEDLLYKDHFVQDNLRVLRSLIKETKDITAIIGFVDIDQKKNLYNAAALIHDRRLRGAAYKQDLPNYGVFDEKRYFKPGKDYPLYSWGGVILGMSICEDIWKDDGLAATQAQDGAGLLINISSSPYHDGKVKLREAMLKRRARQNKTLIVYCNLIGGQDELVFDGGSVIVSPKGEMLFRAKQFEEDLLVADVEIPLSPGRKIQGKTKVIALSVSQGPSPTVRRAGAPSGPYHSQRPPIERHLYSPLETNAEIYQALVLGTRDYVYKNGFQKVVVGLSGGIDSSLVAVIACDAVGKENTIGVSMPSQYSSEGTRLDAQTVAGNLGIRFMTVPIEGIFNTYLFALRREFAGQGFDVTEENLQARIRGNILMALSNKFGWLVLTTGNKSEIAVGYCTLYGDMSGGFAVIKDLPKTKVYELVQFRNQRGPKALIPESVLERAPTAELRENQKDQDSLPPYEVLDTILKSYVEERASFPKMLKKHQNQDQLVLKKVISLVDQSEYKRRQAPPGVKITARAFGKDWRLPITNKYKEF